MNSFIPEKDRRASDIPAMGFNTVLKKLHRTLDDRELRIVQSLINTRCAGKGKLSEIIAEHWDQVRSKRSFGRRFKAAVCSGALYGIELLPKKSSGSCVYEIRHQSQAANDAAQRLALACMSMKAARRFRRPTDSSIVSSAGT